MSLSLQKLRKHLFSQKNEGKTTRPRDWTHLIRIVKYPICISAVYRFHLERYFSFQFPFLIGIRGFENESLQGSSTEGYTYNMYVLRITFKCKSVYKWDQQKENISSAEGSQVRSADLDEAKIIPAKDADNTYCIHIQEHVKKFI